MQRYGRIKFIMQSSVSEPDPLQKTLLTERLDDVFLHRRWGYFILLAVLFLLFQMVFWLAQFPMDWIDSGFAKLNSSLTSSLPKAWWSDLLTNGVLAGLCGIFGFFPQIMILFWFISFLG